MRNRSNDVYRKPEVPVIASSSSETPPPSPPVYDCTSTQFETDTEYLNTEAEDFEIQTGEGECVNKVGKQVLNTDKDYELMRIIQRTFMRGAGESHIDSQDPLGASVVTEEDFMVDQTISFRNSPYEVKMYNPSVFRLIRTHLDVGERDFHQSLNGTNGAYTKIGTPGKSGAFFFFTHSQRVTEEELVTLLEMLPNYYKHIESRRKETLLSQFYCLFEVTKIGASKMCYRFVCMNNLFFSNKVINRRYDLKGSTAGRFASEKELSNKNPILKDNDINEGDIRLTPQLKKRLYERIVADVRFLKQNDIIDYSLLMGVHSTSCEENGDNQKFFGAYNQACYSIDRGEVYLIGIIDILQRYNNRKQLEKALKTGMSALKSKISKREKEKVSVQKPFKYSRRFEQFIKILCSHVDIKQYPLGSRKTYRINQDLTLCQIEEYYQKQVWHDPLNHQVYYYRGLMNFGLLKWDEMSRFDFSKSISMGPKELKDNDEANNMILVNTYLFRGMTLERMGLFEEAKNDYTNLIKIVPNCADAYLMRGALFHESMNDYAQADKDYKKCLSINPYGYDPFKFHRTLRSLGADSVDVRIQLALMQRSRDGSARANQNLYKQLSDMIQQSEIESNKERYAPSYYCYFLRGLLAQSVDKNKALSDLNRAVELNPVHAACYFFRAQVQSVVTLKIEDYTNTIKYCPDHLEAHLKRATLHYERGMETLAIADLDTCLDLFRYKRFSDVPYACRQALLHRELQQRLTSSPCSVLVQHEDRHQVMLRKSQLKPSPVQSNSVSLFPTNNNEPTFDEDYTEQTIKAKKTMTKQIYGGHHMRGEDHIMYDDRGIVAQALNLRASMKIKSKDYVGAESDYMEAIRIDPSYANTYYNLSMFYLKETNDQHKAKPFMNLFRETSQESNAFSTI
ncbi:PIP5K6 [Acrasis kona]|uniref:PIP5K6 n=1 Tax=Acrasis kona TaxID=1008807 RepID=A0AAW2YUJ1_9EUKA